MYYYYYENRTHGTQIKTIYYFKTENWGTGITGLMRGMAILPQCNQELLVVRDKVGRSPGELEVS